MNRLITFVSSQCATFMLQISSGLKAAKERKEDLLAQLDAENVKISSFTSEVEETKTAINEVRSQFSAELKLIKEKGGALKEKRETLKNNLDEIDEQLKSAKGREKRLIDAYDSKSRILDRVQQNLAADKILKDIMERLSECCIEMMGYGFYANILLLEAPVIELEVALDDAYEEIKMVDEAIGRDKDRIQAYQTEIKSLEEQKKKAVSEAKFQMAGNYEDEVKKLTLPLVELEYNIECECEVRDAHLRHIQEIQSKLSASRLEFQARRNDLIANELSLMHRIRLKKEALKAETESLINKFSDDADYVASMICSIIDDRMNFLTKLEQELLPKFTRCEMEEEESLIVTAPDSIDAVTPINDQGITLLLAAAAIACVHKDDEEEDVHGIHDFVSWPE
jgi:chromosome segregation ATPase